MAVIIGIIACVALIFALAMNRASLRSWALAAVLFTLAAQMGVFAGDLHWPLAGFWRLLGWIPAILLVALTFDQLRRDYIVKPAHKALRGFIPSVSATEREALEAGTIGFDAELFSGVPDWTRLRRVPPIVLTDEERAFLEGPTQELCERLDDWKIRHELHDIPDDVWDFVRARGFLGMLISKQHGGLGFSAQAQSLIIGKISSKSADGVTIVMVPNSLGPGELIEQYGTEEQKHHFLPRLARGDEIPCFALTGPFSGSDAASMRDIGVVERGTHDGEETLGVRLRWDKRYITLAPKATLLGLAFRLYDPEHMLGARDEIGITLALIPTDHPGVQIGRRHLPCGAAFPNGPTWGHDVFIPLDWIIGGKERAGHGWRMLMSCLAAGRAISLPATSAAAAKSMLRASTAYARIRKQFNLPIGHMEGVEEPLARMVEQAYVLEAGRSVTAAMVSSGEKPAVISALLKYQSTERMRQCVNDAFDIHGGRAICDGPSNYLQAAYQMVPVGITVEGANILTRTLITFAQGALRSHPWLMQEVAALEEPNQKKSLDDFDTAFSGHVGFALSNVFGALFHNLTLGRFAAAPAHARETTGWYAQVSRGSRSFALVADMTVAMLGGGLKTKQKITGRLADALSELYLLTCVLKRFEDDGSPAADLPIVDYCAQNCLARFDEALKGVLENFPVRWAGIVMTPLVFPYGSRRRPASDTHGKAIVRLALEPGEVRDRLTRDIHLSGDVTGRGLLDHTLAKVVALGEADRKLERAVRMGEVRRVHGNDWIAEAASKGVITPEEATGLAEMQQLVERVIAVDDFSPEEAVGRGKAATKVQPREHMAAE